MPIEATLSPRAVSDAQGRRLESWKEIAAHLGVGVRTAQVWERERSLPVHRLPGSRGRVFVSVAELDAWREGQAADSLVREEPTIPSTSWRVWAHCAIRSATRMDVEGGQ